MPADLAYRRGPSLQKSSSQFGHSLLCSSNYLHSPLDRNVFDPRGRFWNRSSQRKHTLVDRSLLFLEHILEDELPPGTAARLHKCATLVEVRQLDVRKPESFGQIRY